MVTSFKQIRLTNADVLFTGGAVRASGRNLAYDDIVVHKTGAEIISGSKSFANQVTVSGSFFSNDIFSNVNQSSISVQFGKVYDSGNNDAIHWNPRSLIDNSLGTTLNWQDKVLSGTWNAQGLTVTGVSVVNAGQTGNFIEKSYNSQKNTKLNIYSTAFATSPIFFDGEDNQVFYLITPDTGANLVRASINLGTNTANTITARTISGFNLIQSNNITATGTISATGQIFAQGQAVVTGSVVRPTETGTFVTTTDSRGLSLGAVTGTSFVVTSSFNTSTRILTGIWSAQDLLVSGFPVVTSNQTGSFITSGVVTGSFMTKSSWQIFATTIPTGVDSYFVSFPSGNFSSAPKISVTLEVTGDILYNTAIRSRTISGYTLLLSDTTVESGILAHTFATIN